MTENKVDNGTENQAFDPQKQSEAIGYKVLDRMVSAYKMGYVLKDKNIDKNAKKEMLARDFVEKTIKRELRTDESITLEEDEGDIRISLNSDDKDAVADVDWYFQKDEETEELETPKDISFNRFFGTLHNFTMKYAEMALIRGEKDAEAYFKTKENKGTDKTVDMKTCMTLDFAEFLTELYLKRKLNPCEVILADGEPTDPKDIFGKFTVYTAFTEGVAPKLSPIKVDVNLLALRLTNEFLQNLIEKIEETENDRE